MIKMNKVSICGRLGKDAESITIAGDKVIVKASIAVSDNYKDKEGNWVDNASWFRLVFLIPAVAERAQTLLKGDNVFIEGKLVENRYTNKEGKDVSSVEIHVMSFQVEKKSDSLTAQAPKTNGKIADIPVESPTEEDDLPF